MPQACNDDDDRHARPHYSSGAFTPTWLSFSGLPGCGKTTLVDKLIPILDSDGWAQVILLPESVCKTDSLCAFYQRPREIACRLQSEAIDKYCITLSQAEHEIERKNERKPFIVVEHTSVDTIFFFTAAYRKLGFITENDYDFLMEKLDVAKMHRERVRSNLRKIDVCYEKLNLDVMLQNIFRRENRRRTKIPYVEEMLRSALREVNFARHVSLHSCRKRETRDLLTVYYTPNHYPTALVVESLRNFVQHKKRGEKRKRESEYLCTNKRRKNIEEETLICEIVRF